MRLLSGGGLGLGRGGCDFAELNGVEVGVGTGGVADDDEFVAGVDEMACAQQFFGLGDGLIGGRVEGEGERGGAPIEGEVPGDGFRWSDGEDGGVIGAEAGDVIGHDAASGEDEEFCAGQRVGEGDGGADGFLAFVFEEGVIGEASAATAFDASCDAVEGFDAFDGVFSGGGFAGEHDGVGLFEDGVGDIGDFGASGDRVDDHRLEEMSGDDDWASAFDAAFDDASLDDREILHGAFDAEVAASDHDGVGFADDVIEVSDGELIFDFGDDLGLGGVGFESVAEHVQVAALAAEGEGDEVDGHFCAECHVSEVFFGERGEVDFNAWEIDVAAGAHDALGEDLAADAVSFFGEDFHVDDAVVDEDGVAFGDVIDESVVIDVDGVGFLTAFAADSELEDVAVFELEFCGEVAGADGGALGVEEDGDVALELFADGTDSWNDGADPVVWGVAHVEPEDVDACEDEFLEDFLGIGGWTDGGDDFGFSHEVVRVGIPGERSATESWRCVCAARLGEWRSGALDEFDFVAFGGVDESDDAAGGGLGGAVGEGVAECGGVVGEGPEVLDFESEMGEVRSDDNGAGGFEFADFDELLALGSLEEDELGAARGGVARDFLEAEDLGVEVDGAVEVLDAVTGVKELGDHEARFQASGSRGLDYP